MNAVAQHTRTGPNKSMAVLGWVIAIVLSMGLNLFLFGIMPGLIRSVPQAPDKLEDIRTIQVVRVKPQETPPKKRETPKPPKPDEKPKPAKKVTRIRAPRPAPVKPRLPFELNPELPTFSDSLEMPPLSHFSMTVAAPTAPKAPRGPYSVGELDGPLTPVAQVPPVYPQRAARLGIQGRVKVKFVVTVQGQVEQIEILEADPEGVFENAAVKCISQWRFKPGTVDGVAVAAQRNITFRFDLKQ